MSDTNGLSYEHLCDRLKEMDALVAAIRHEEVDAIVGEKNIVLLDSARRLEEALRESHEKFNALFDASPMAIVLYDTDGKILHVNKSCLSLFGVAEVRDILNFDILSHKRLSRGIYDDILSGKPVNYQARLDFAEAAGLGLTNCRKTGVLYMDVFIAPLPRPQEQTVSGYLVKISDITAQRMAEEHVAFQAKLLESVEEAVVATDMEGRITYWGKGAEKMFGKPGREMLGRPVGDVFYSKGLFEDMIFQSRETDSSAAEYAMPKQDGEVMWLDTTLSRIRIPDGNPVGIVGILRDISERKRAEDALKNREKQLEMLYQKFITAQEEERKRLSRELHDSIGQKIISMQLEITWLKNQESRDTHKDIYKNIVKMTVDASDELQQICLGLRPLIMDRISFTAAIKALLEEFESKSDMVIDARIMPVDETRFSPETRMNIYRIIQEAVANIARHSNTKTAFVSLREEGSELVLSVSDEGAGLPEEKSSRKYSYGIIGMRERANMCGGVFEIKSSPGKGTHIRVSVPAARPAEEPDK